MTNPKPCLKECYRVINDGPPPPKSRTVHAPACPNAEAPKVETCGDHYPGARYSNCAEADLSFALSGAWQANHPKPAPAPEPKQERKELHGEGDGTTGSHPRSFRGSELAPDTVLNAVAPRHEDRAEQKQGSACCEECKRFHRHFRTDCCKCRTSFGPSDIPEAEPKQGACEDRLCDLPKGHARPHRLRGDALTSTWNDEPKQGSYACRGCGKSLPVPVTTKTCNECFVREGQQGSEEPIDAQMARRFENSESPPERGLARAYLALRAEVEAETKRADRGWLERGKLEAKLAVASAQLAEKEREIAELSVLVKYPVNSMCRNDHELVLWDAHEWEDCPVCRERAAILAARKGESR